MAAARRGRRSEGGGTHTGALFNLGIMHAGGRGAPRDPVQAHMWFALAAARGDAQAARAQIAMAAHMTPPAEIAEAERLAEASGLAP